MRSSYDVVLLPSFIQVEAWRKGRADAGPGGMFCQTATTFNAWIADLWELYGDGRALVDSVGRAALMRLAFSQLARESADAGDAAAEALAGNGGADAGADDEQEDPGVLTLAPGTARAAARCERAAAGLAEYDAAVEAACSGDPGEVSAGPAAALSPRELVFLQGVARYRELLEARSLVEPGEACRLLAAAGAEVFPRPLGVLVQDAAPLSWQMERFFSSCPNLRVRVAEAPGAHGIVPAQAGVRVRLANPAGRYAVPAAVMQALEGLGPGERAVVTCADPLALYRQLEPALARAGLVGGVQAMMRFGEVDFGRAYLTALRAVCDDVWQPADFADLLHTPFAGVAPLAAREYDMRLRADRIVARETCIAELCERSDDFSALVALVRSEDPDALLDRFARMTAELPGRSPTWRAQQYAAIDGLRAVSSLIGPGKAGWRDRAVVLEQMAVTVSAAGLPGHGLARPDVLVTTQGAAAQLAPGSCALLMAADLTAEAYPLAQREDAVVMLLDKLGLSETDDALTRARRTFTALMRVPARELVCMRPQNDVDGNPAYASATLEELLDACREAVGDAPGSAAPDADAATPRRASGVVEEVPCRGEDSLYANAMASALPVSQPVAAYAREAATGALASPDADVMLPPRRLRAAEGQAGVLRRSPSPSQIELYLECPYRWFASRRLGLATLEEGFGALERGTFAHAVLERFYRTFLEAGFGKVSEDNIDRARATLREAANAVRRGMRGQRPGSGRWVAANSLEEREIDQMTRQLVDFLDFERQILPGFRPAYLEYAFGADDAVEYAGRPLVGIVDRIDVDDAGHAVVIDYKGSVATAHDIGGKTPESPGKVQARIYAQMVERALGLRVVGALYVSYGATHRLAGAADSRVLEAAHLPGARPDAIWCALGEEAEGAGAVAVPGGEARPAGAGGKTASAGQDAPAFGDLPFGRMLDATEELVAHALRRMEAGDVAPHPADAGVCEFCPVSACPSRLAKRRG